VDPLAPCVLINSLLWISFNNNAAPGQADISTETNEAIQGDESPHCYYENGHRQSPPPHHMVRVASHGLYWCDGGALLLPRACSLHIVAAMQAEESP
jgi:hypothetical protein